MTSKLDYLKKYVSKDESLPGEEGDKSKKKKKKKKAKAPSGHRGGGNFAIVDDDVDWRSLVPRERRADSEEEEEEDKPVVAEMRDETVVKWQPFGNSSAQKEEEKQVSDLSPTRQGSPDNSRQRRGRHDSPDIGPPRRKRHDSPDISPPRRKRHDSPDIGPPRRKRHDSPDIGPPRRKRRDSPDISPPRRKRHDSPDISPPRRKRHDSPDISPPRRKRHDSPDISPPRRKRHDSPDISPPRRKRHDSPDISPPRRKRHDSPDISPPRRKRHDSPDISPPCKPRPFVTSDKQPNGNRDSSRRKNSITSVGSKRFPPPSRPSNQSSNRPPSPTRMSSRKKAGLQDAEVLRQETAAARAREEEMFRRMDPSESGRGAETVHRDKEGRKINLKLERLQKMQEENKKIEEEEKFMQWGKGVATLKMAEEKVKDELYEMSKPLARYADDEDLERMLKARERDGDPMLKFIKKKPKMTPTGKPKKERPTYRGSFPANRFGIRPGYRWDGVDRTNGFEKAWFARDTNSKATADVAYKWSVENM